MERARRGIIGIAIRALRRGRAFFRIGFVFREEIAPLRLLYALFGSGSALYGFAIRRAQARFTGARYIRHPPMVHHLVLTRPHNAQCGLVFDFKSCFSNSRINSAVSSGVLRRPEP